MMATELVIKAGTFAMEALLALSITIVSLIVAKILEMIATMFVREATATMDMASRAVMVAKTVEATTRLF